MALIELTDVVKQYRIGTQEIRALDGVSLTVNAIPKAGTVQVSLIPYTRLHTTLGQLRVGDRVHVEGDMIGKFVRQLVQGRE